MVRRGLIAVLIGAVMLAFPAGRAAASAPVPSFFPTRVQLAMPPGAPGDYVIEAYTCTGDLEVAATCGEIIDESPGSTSFSTPPLVAFGCYTAVDGTFRGTAVVAGNWFGSSTATSHDSGVAGVSGETGGPGQTTWQAMGLNILTGSSTVNPWDTSLHGGVTSGSSVGLIQVNNKTGVITGGSIHISLTGTIYTDGTNAMYQGTISCTIPTGPVASPHLRALATNQSIE